jgi:peptidoglycan/xylan/chitin deacetylase (PgdA/CDA1 family)
MWHYVREESETPRVGAGWLSPAAFDAQLEAIARHRTVVDWPAVAAALASGPPLPPRAALLTFDDGLVDHHRVVLPRLAARGWPAVFFALARRPGALTVGHQLHILLAECPPAELRQLIAERLSADDRARLVAAEARERSAHLAPIDVLKRPLQRDLAGTVGPILSALIEERHGSEPEIADALHLSAGQIDDLRANGMTIGGHGRRHLWFDWEPMAEVRQELEDSADWLSPEPRPWAFAYPYGAADDRAKSALAASEFDAAFHARPTAATGAYDIGRIDAEGPGFAAIVAASEPP